MAKILIIEDDKVTQRLYEKALKSEGHEILHQYDSNINTSEIQQMKPNLIMLDIMLPGQKNGFDLLEEIKKDSKLKNIPVIVLTNLGSEENVAKQIGASEYIVKAQTSIDEIIEKVKHHV